jgi:hypothetical protein
MERLYQTVSKLDGVPYLWGGTSTNWGMDCSAFAQYVMREVGIKIPRTTKEQADVGQLVKTKHVKPGDLIFFDASKQRSGIDHVGIYLGRGYFVHSASPVGVKMDHLRTYDHKVKFGRRVIHSKFDIWEETKPVVYEPDPEPTLSSMMKSQTISPMPGLSVTDPKPKFPPRRRHPEYETEPRAKIPYGYRPALEPGMADEPFAYGQISKPNIDKVFVHRKKGRGRLVSLEMEEDTVYYTVHLRGNRYYKFPTYWKDHKELSEAHKGNLLDQVIRWDEDSFDVDE